MPIIAEHCRPEGWRGRATRYTPVCQWPDDCYVQWGESGIVVPRDAPSYRTAFFEAFPKDPATFNRGEGKSVEAAECSAFAKWTHIQKCRGHEFERGVFRNGAGFCKHCRLFNSRAFDPLTVCATCATPTYFHRVPKESRAGDEIWLCEDHAPPEEERMAAVLANLTDHGKEAGAIG